MGEARRRGTYEDRVQQSQQNAALLRAAETLAKAKAKQDGADWLRIGWRARRERLREAANTILSERARIARQAAAEKLAAQA